HRRHRHKRRSCICRDRWREWYSWTRWFDSCSSCKHLVGVVGFVSVVTFKLPHSHGLHGFFRVSDRGPSWCSLAMSDSLFVRGQLHAPYFIFVRCAGKYSDADLLLRLGLSAYRRTKTARYLGHYAIVADDGQWTMIANDWYYTLWHMPSTRPALEELGRNCDVF